MADAYWDPNGDEPVSATKLNNGAAFSAANVTDLKTIDTTDTPNGQKYITDDNGNLYIFDSSSSATGNDYSIVQPTTGSGRWILKTSGGNGVADVITTDTAAVPGKSYIANSTDRLEVTLPSVISVGQIISVFSRNTGGWKVKLATGQTVKYAASAISGAGAAFLSTQSYSSIQLMCSVANTEFILFQSQGTNTITYASGYFLGGEISGPSYTAVIEDFKFYNETSAVIVATLDAARKNIAGVESSEKGYAAGGQISGPAKVDTITAFDFNSETDADLAAVLSAALEGATGTQSTTKGYFMGGITPSFINVIRALTFSSETAASLAATLDSTNAFGTGVQSSTKGYHMGGQTNSLNDINELIFSNESSAAIAATLSIPKYAADGASNATDGYIFGGYNDVSVLNSFEKLIFSSETTASVSATLATARKSPSAVCDGAIAYIAGGNNNSTTYYSSIEKFTMSSETAGTVSASLDTAKSGMAGVNYAG